MLFIGNTMLNSLMNETKYAIRVPFPDEDGWIFVTKDPGLLDEPGIPVVKKFDTHAEAEEFGKMFKSCHIVAITNGEWTDCNNPNSDNS
jgi:hypothetical protein